MHRDPVPTGRRTLTGAGGPEKFAWYQPWAPLRPQLNLIGNLDMRFDDLFVGQTASFSKTVTETDVGLFAGITGDFNPLHVNEPAAVASQFGNRIAHGMLSASLICTVLGMHLPGPGTVHLSQTLRFVRPVRLGDTVTATAEVVELIAAKRRVRLRTVCANQDGEPVIEGEALVMLPQT